MVLYLIYIYDIDIYIDIRYIYIYIYMQYIHTLIFNIANCGINDAPVIYLTPIWAGVSHDDICMIERGY